MERHIVSDCKLAASMAGLETEAPGDRPSAEGVQDM